jgi:hypothetical protein
VIAPAPAVVAYRCPACGRTVRATADGAFFHTVQRHQAVRANPATGAKAEWCAVTAVALRGAVSL